MKKVVQSVKNGREKKVKNDQTAYVYSCQEGSLFTDIRHLKTSRSIYLFNSSVHYHIGTRHTRGIPKKSGPSQVPNSGPIPDHFCHFGPDPDQVRNSGP